MRLLFTLLLLAALATTAHAWTTQAIAVNSVTLTAINSDSLAPLTEPQYEAASDRIKLRIRIQLPVQPEAETLYALQIYLLRFGVQGKSVLPQAGPPIVSGYVMGNQTVVEVPSEAFTVPTPRPDAIDLRISIRKQLDADGPLTDMRWTRCTAWGAECTF
jgi:hypothetical protein